MSQVTSGLNKDSNHFLIHEARTCRVGHPHEMDPRERLGLFLIGALRALAYRPAVTMPELRALLAEYRVEIAAHEIAADIVAERMQVTQAHYAPIVKPEPKPEPAPAPKPPASGPREKVKLFLPGRAEPQPNRRMAVRWDCVCGAIGNQGAETHCAECMGFRLECEALLNQPEPALA